MPSAGLLGAEGLQLPNMQTFGAHLLRRRLLAELRACSFPVVRRNGAPGIHANDGGNGREIMLSTAPEFVIPARNQVGLDRVLAYLSAHADEIRVSWSPQGPFVRVRPKAMLDVFGEPLPRPHRIELEAPGMIERGIAKTVEVCDNGLIVETPSGLKFAVEWLLPHSAS